MIVTLTPNPAADVTYGVDAVHLGDSHRVHDMTERAGGKGLNVASVLTGLGEHAVAVAPVGAADLAAWAADLTDRGVSHRLVESPSATRRSIAVVEADGRTTLFNEAGQPQPDAVWTRVAEALAALSDQAEVLTVSGSLPAEAPDDLVARFVVEAARRGLHTVVDCGGAALAAALPAGPRLVKPNRTEAVATLGVDAGTSPRALARLLLERGAGAAVVTDGASGLELVAPDVSLRARLREPLRGNPTGAGDAMTAALAVELRDASGLPSGVDAWAEALRRAVAWSAAAVLQPVAGVVDPDDAARLFQSVQIEESPA
ncbi:1-phosphofructokinase family hexose kinase [Intrasporangium flavum]|uniref:1-phosphofructokinase family hexose kinase n=1 Tax=Intrasporangium flavum TaxID=1428657 RepID=UPI00096C29FE|nr:hexose kinase [Intrasporangium flavum]